MVTSAALLLAAVLLLGGIIAVLGDRLGTKIGKARLRIFGLRPRQTATVVTIITGTLISATTLGILFASSKPLRQGVFEIDDILQQKRIAEGELGSVSAERDRVTQELNRVSDEKLQVEQGLNRSQDLLTNTNEQLGDLRDRLQNLRSERQRLAKERQTLIKQRQALLREIPKLQTSVKERDRELARQDEKLDQRDRIIERKESEISQKNQSIRTQEKRLQNIETQRLQLQDELNERDAKLAELDRSIAEGDRLLKSRETELQERDRLLQEREKQLAQLEQEIATLQNQLQNLATYYQEFRQGNVALFRGQVLAYGVVRILEPEAAKDAVDQLLREANRVATAATRPSNSNDPVKERIVQISANQVEQLIDKINDGQEYAVQILAAENYVEQETPVLVVADAVRNSLVFQENETIATVALDPSDISSEEIQNRIDVLLAAAQFRSQRAGILGGTQVEEGRIITLTQFIETAIATPEKFDQISAIATQQTYVSGPLKLKLLAFKDGKIVFST
ncbi:MAG: DUF3084 domain-containing protein [Jaaginema sp. PMC 1079.18]|nr:DUF3084 domain-containing protein [Jaaginema sp. PMC 1080.18]MEC4850303.1 DUF3084 domain-containing protein [Jaaginema sp. PMC 1079.18]MEC4865873.1 DUF3084 domain-containing protein [Jaaginema sp. PMC 1078.18]